MLDHDRLIETVQARAALESPALANMTIAATLTAIGRMLEPEVGRELLALLPEQLRVPLRHGLASPERSSDLLADVAAQEHVNLGFAKEHAAVVCEALAEELDDRSLVQMRQLLPEAIAQLLVRHQTPPPPLPHTPFGPHARKHNLAEGRPGSAQPLSDAPTWAGHADSPAVSRDPKGDSNLAGAKGPRHDHSLASGRPGSRRPLSETEP